MILRFSDGEATGCHATTLNSIHMKKVPFRFGSHYLYGFLLLSLLTACDQSILKPKKDKKDQDPKSQLSRAWRMDRVLANSRPYSGTEFTNWRFDFHEEGTYSLSTNTESGQGQWELDSSGRQLILDKGTAGEISFTVLQMNDSLLELETVQTVNNAGQVRLVFQLKPA